MEIVKKLTSHRCQFFCGKMEFVELTQNLSNKIIITFIKINIQRSIKILDASSGDPFCSRRQKGRKTPFQKKILKITLKSTHTNFDSATVAHSLTVQQFCYAKPPYGCRPSCRCISDATRCRRLCRLYPRTPMKQ